MIDPHKGGGFLFLMVYTRILMVHYGYKHLIQQYLIVNHNIRFSKIKIKTESFKY